MITFKTITQDSESFVHPVQTGYSYVIYTVIHDSMNRPADDIRMYTLSPNGAWRYSPDVAIDGGAYNFDIEENVNSNTQTDIRVYRVFSIPATIKFKLIWL